MQAVRIAGGGLTPFGQFPNRTSRDLFAEAAESALNDAGVKCEDVDHLCFGNFVGDVAERQGHQGPLMAEMAGVSAPATRYESACAAGGMAVRGAVQKIRLGEADVVIVGGAEQLNTLDTGGATEALAMAADELYESRVGVTFPGAYALMARAYFAEHGGTREDLAAISVKNHENAVHNEYAQFRNKITIDDVLDAPTVADPLGLYDSCPVSDGAATAVLVSESYAREHDLEAPVTITGSGQGGDTLALQGRSTLTHTPATKQAAEAAYANAGITADAVQVAEVHDCFTIAEVLAIESLGFFEYGNGIAAAAEGHTTRDGSVSVNLSGGLKAKGHPVGATGVAQIVELTRLFRGDHPNSSAIADATVGVAHNAGGTVASAVVHVLEVER
ncbi:thiolase domain-containing protein [Haladaptatus sp. DFWS20]|uniref:thiolase domain-containing protein n=1 Tax=Haladaptatus sp. DFWS20 TaxID=3403467 RepID=UPI003EB7515E